MFYTGNRAKGQEIINELEKFAREAAGKIKDFVENIETTKGATTATQTSTGMNVPVDIHQTTTHVIVHCELPGVRKEDIQVILKKNGQLDLSGTKRNEINTSETVLRTERTYGAFHKIIDLEAQDIDDDSEITAKMTDGILEIRLAKSANSNGVNVDIE